MNDEILVVPRWTYIWWDIEKSREFTGAITGTFGNFPNIDRRYVEKGFTLYHAPDLGKLETKWTTRWEDTRSYTTMWKECKICGEKFDVQEL